MVCPVYIRCASHSNTTERDKVLEELHDIAEQLRILKLFRKADIMDGCIEELRTPAPVQPWQHMQTVINTPRQEINGVLNSAKRTTVVILTFAHKIKGGLMGVE